MHRACEISNPKALSRITFEVADTLAISDEERTPGFHQSRSALVLPHLTQHPEYELCLREVHHP